MERPWLILRRVLDVGPPGLHADAEEHAVVVQAEADAQAQEEQHAGVEEAEEHDVAAEDAAVEAQAQHDAVAEAEADAQAQEEEHAIQLEESVVNVNTDAVASELAHAAMDAGAPDFTITVARPPWVSSLFAGLHSHPDPARPDMYPYIIATGRFCLLVHFAIAPSYGTNFDQEPEHSHLVVVRHFLRDDDGAEIDACAVPVPDRAFDDFVNVPALSNIESVGLVCYQETGHYQIAELIVTTGAPQAVVVYIRTDTGVWLDNLLDLPLAMDPRRDWVPHGTVTINSTVLWYDLTWGIISCDLAQPPLLQVLNFHRLPPGRVLRAGSLPDLHCRRCIAVSENLVRYVEIILSPHGHGAATVNMWYRDVEDNPWRWEMNYTESFEDIWDHESYAQTELPPNPPMLVGVSPVNSNVVYFSLNQRLFGVNVPEHTVVDCEQYEPLNRPGPDDEPVTSRYLITWNLDADGVTCSKCQCTDRIA
ncbi:uncharacterized protein [Miscanthus floridulus]|uniref:uncharacterized protein n=1 Tax=Miscanthus floridulus TaxID=154761 RepID=UPI003458BA51